MPLLLHQCSLWSLGLAASDSFRNLAFATARVYALLHDNLPAFLAGCATPCRAAEESAFPCAQCLGLGTGWDGLV